MLSQFSQFEDRAPKEKIRALQARAMELEDCKIQLWEAISEQDHLKVKELLDDQNIRKNNIEFEKICRAIEDIRGPQKGLTMNCFMLAIDYQDNAEIKNEILSYADIREVLGFLLRYPENVNAVQSVCDSYGLPQPLGAKSSAKL